MSGAGWANSTPAEVKGPKPLMCNLAWGDAWQVLGAERVGCLTKSKDRLLHFVFS